MKDNIARSGFRGFKDAGGAMRRPQDDNPFDYADFEPVRTELVRNEEDFRLPLENLFPFSFPEDERG